MGQGPHEDKPERRRRRGRSEQEDSVDGGFYLEDEIRAGHWEAAGSFLRSLLVYVGVAACCLAVAMGTVIMQRGWDGFLALLGWK
jgi:hypothetical protein